MPMRMKIHTGCICMAFLQCVFSHVPANCLFQWVHIYTEYICMIFLYEDDIHKRKENHSKRALPIKLIPDTYHRHCHVEKFFHLTDCLVEKFST